MTEQQAQLKGLQFTGAYSSTDKESIKEEAKLIRDEGYRAVVVTEISKGRNYNTTGYSVYAERKYFVERDLTYTTNLKNNLPELHKKQLEELISKQQAEIQKFSEIIENLTKELETL
jgi:hypothetical protein